MTAAPEHHLARTGAALVMALAVTGTGAASAIQGPEQLHYTCANLRAWQRLTRLVRGHGPAGIAYAARLFAESIITCASPGHRDRDGRPDLKVMAGAGTPSRSALPPSSVAFASAYVEMVDAGRTDAHRRMLATLLRDPRVGDWLLVLRACAAAAVSSRPAEEWPDRAYLIARKAGECSGADLSASPY